VDKRGKSEPGFDLSGFAWQLRLFSLSCRRKERASIAPSPCRNWDRSRGNGAGVFLGRSAAITRTDVLAVANLAHVIASGPRVNKRLTFDKSITVKYLGDRAMSCQSALAMATP